MGPFEPMLRLSALLITATLLAAQQGPYPILTIQVEGNSRFAVEPVIRAAGLQIGTKAAKEDFEAACKRLVDTGLFTTANYRYRPADTKGEPGFDLTLVVAENDDLREARIEIPGAEELQVWTWLEQNEPLVTRQMPANDQATAFYLRAIERYMAGQGRHETLTALLRTDPVTAAIVTVFRPTDLARISAVKFEGAQSVPAAALEKALAPAAIGAEFSERGFRELLEYNVRRLYDEQGRLGVRFPRISATKDAAGSLTVTTSIEEGAVFHIASVEIAGDRLPAAYLKSLVDLTPGGIAEWQKVRLNATKIQTAMGHEGYLDASAEIERELDEPRAAVHITFVVEKGLQSKFGALRLDGLDAASAERSRTFWKLAPGAVINTELVDQFERSLMRDDKIRFRRISRRYERRAGDVVDVIFTFK